MRGIFSDSCVRKFKDVPVTPHLILEIVQIASQLSSTKLLLTSFEVHDCLLKSLF